MQALPIDAQKVRFRALSQPVPHNEFGSNTQKVNRDGELLFKVKVLVSTDGGDSEVIWVKVPGSPVGLKPESPVKVSGLTILPWSNEKGSGVTYFADAIEVEGGARP